VHHARRGADHRLADNDPGPAQRIRYQLGNHLGSVSLELDGEGQIISYEEYTPYGSTSYQAVRSQTETPKRYRYTGKERDEESGFIIMARYHAPWLGRWMSCDPTGVKADVDLYRYSLGNPVKFVDIGAPHTLDAVGGYYVGFWDGVLVMDSDMWLKSDEWKQTYAKAKQFCIRVIVTD
jgi:RHS repeat-associated protein